MVPPSPSSQSSDRLASAISREEVLARLRDPAFLLVNVLPRIAYDEAHIAGSLNLPLSEIDARARVVIPDLARDIAVYCGGPT